MTGAPGPAPGGGLWLFLLASIVVIGLTYAASRAVGNWQQVQTRGRRLRVLEALNVGKDRNLMLVAVGKELLVVGASPTGIAVVHQVNDPEVVAELMAQQPEATPISGLASLAAFGSVASVAPAAENAIRESVARMKALLGRQGEQGHD